MDGSDIQAASARTPNALRRIAGGGLWAILAYGCSSGAVFVVSIIVGRSLGPGPLGDYSFHLWVLRLVPTLLALGFPLALTKMVAEREGSGTDGRALFRLARRTHLLLLSVPCAVAATWGGGTDWRLTLIMLVGIAVILLALDYEALLVGERRFRALTLVAVLGAGAQLLAAAIGLLVRVDWQGFIALSVAAAVFSLVALVLVCGSAAAPVPAAALGPGDRRAFFRLAGLLAIYVIVNEVVWGRPELWFLDRYRSDAEVGLYAAALRLTSLPVMVPIVAARAIMPEFSWLLGGGRKEELDRTYPSVCTVLALVTVPLAFGGVVLAEAAVTTVYGQAFESASGATAILLGGSMIYAMAGPAVAAVLTGPRLRLIAEVGLVATVLNLVFDLLLIPAFGLTGAAIANVAAQTVFMVTAMLYARLRLGLSYPVRTVLRLCLLAGLAALAAAAVLRAGSGPLMLCLAGLVDVAVFAVLVVVTRTVSASDLRMSPTAEARAG
jgi:O-antigen/teichoic acid export membrane protein